MPSKRSRSKHCDDHVHRRPRTRGYWRNIQTWRSTSFSAQNRSQAPLSSYDVPSSSQPAPFATQPDPSTSLPDSSPNPPAPQAAPSSAQPAPSSLLPGEDDQRTEDQELEYPAEPRFNPVTSSPTGIPIPSEDPLIFIEDVNEGDDDNKQDELVDDSDNKQDELVDHSDAPHEVLDSNTEENRNSLVHDFTVHQEHRSSIPRSEFTIRSFLEGVFPDGVDTFGQFFESLLKGLRRYMTATTFTGLILLYGSAPLSCRQYLLVTNLISYFLLALNQDDGKNDQAKRSRFTCGLTKTRQSVFPHIIATILPKSAVISVEAGHQSIKPTENWAPETSECYATDDLPIGLISDVLNDNDSSGDRPQFGDGKMTDGLVQGAGGADSVHEEEQSEDIAEVPSAPQNTDPTPEKKSSKDCFVVRPSEWSRYDLLNPQFLQHIKDQQRLISERGTASGVDSPQSFANSAIVRNPSSVYNRDMKLWIRSQQADLLEPANIGDVVRVNSLLPAQNESFVEGIRANGWRCSDNLSYFNGVVHAVWNAGSTSIDENNSEQSRHPDKRHQKSQLVPQETALDQDLKQVVRYLEKNLTHPSVLAAQVKAYNKAITRRGDKRGATPDSSHKRKILPGDTCTILGATSPSNDSTSSPSNDSISSNLVVAVLVDRFLRSNKWPSTKFVLWFSFSSQSSAPGQRSDPSVLLVSRSTGQPVLLRKNEDGLEDLRSNEDITGTLCNGEKFYVYRFMLYSDDFGPRSTLFPKGSVGGVYIRPVDVPLNILRSPQCIHPISLAPTGVSSNVIINQVIEDVLYCSEHGFRSIDADGELCTIFLHLIAYVGDYPESSAVIDVMKHSARAPCTLCNFRYKKTTFGQSYCHSTSTTSKNSAFTRGWFRTKAIRYSGLTKKEYKWLGMNVGDMGEKFGTIDEQWVLLKLADSFDRWRDSGKSAPLTNLGIPVVPCRFDPYLQNLVAPDHCITGIVKSLLHVCFSELGGSQRSILDSTLVAAITKMGIMGQTTLYNQKAKTLNGVSMSTLFAIISVLPSILSACGYDKTVPCFKMISSFTSLISTLYSWPTYGQCDLVSFRNVHKSVQYFIDSNKGLSDFIGNLQKYYATNGTNANQIDSPNVHRLIELIISTLPTFGHCLLFAELPFEAFHQSLKRILSKNTTAKAHLTAMQGVLFTDWFRRVSSTMAGIGDGNGISDELIPLARVILPYGHFLFNKNFEERDVLSFRSAVLDHIRSNLLGPLSCFMTDHYTSTVYNYTTNSTFSWEESSTTHHKSMIDISVPIDVVERGYNRLLTVIFNCGLDVNGARGYLVSVKVIELIRKQGAESKNSPSKPHRRIGTGDVFEAVCRAGTSGNLVVDAIDSEQLEHIPHEVSNFMILSLYKTEQQQFWAVVVRLHPVQGQHFKCIINKQQIQLLRVSTTVTKCGLLHHCSRDKVCTLRQRKKIIHKLNYNNELNVFLFNYKSGYPFRSA